MNKFTVELVKYDMDKTKKRKRKNFEVGAKTEEAIIERLEKIHKGEKVVTLHEVVWGAEQKTDEKPVEKFTGVIKFYDSEKGFGFIEPDVEMDDLFFHTSALGGEKFYDSDIVEFEIGMGPKGEVAIRIKLIEDEELEPEEGTD